MQKLTVVKIGGNIVDDQKALANFLDIYQNIPGAKILVHGGGKIATKMANDLGIQAQMIQGRRITDNKMLPITVMVYAGLINKSIVAALQERKVDAIGLSGADANIITASKRESNPINYGFVGDFNWQDVKVSRFKDFFHIGLTPVLCAITHDSHGQLLNTNADTIASNISIALALEYEVDLIYCFEHKGVLQNIDNPDSVIAKIDQENFVDLQQKGIINHGMVPKIYNALQATQQGVNKVCIKLAEDLLDPSAGTTIQTNH
ncbi:acetylglutamate kinase [Myroides sp. LJL119]